MQNIQYGIAKTKEEFVLIKELCSKVFENQRIDIFLDDLFFNSPRKNSNICFYAFDIEKKKIIGTLSLLDIQIKYEDIIIKTAELSLAATDPEYRNKKINTNLTKMFFEKCYKKGYNIIILEGIPAFYKRYGFSYAIPMSCEYLKIENLNLKYNPNIKIRSANINDIDFIYNQYSDFVKNISLCKIKDKDIIAAQLLKYNSIVLKKDYYIIENDNNLIGYFAIFPDNDRIELIEISDNLKFEIYESVISYIINTKLSNIKDKTELKFNIPENSKLAYYVRSKGSERNYFYEWQIKILDEFKFLNIIKPALEKRIKNSVYKNEKISFYYNNYKKVIKFDIDNGNINLVEQNFFPTYDFNLYYSAAVRLFFGENDMDEINKFYPDCFVQKEFKDLINILFPKMNYHFITNY